MIIDDADHPAIEGGRYHIGYCEAVDGYRHAFYDEKRRRVRYSRTANHPADQRCPECNPIPAAVQANAAKAKADADTKTAQAQLALQQAQAHAKQAEIAGYGGVENYLKHEAIAAGQNPFQQQFVVSGTTPGSTK